GLETPFLKNALDKVGVQAEFEQRHEFKSAIETLTRDAMSAPARASLLQVMTAWFDRIVADIAKDRKISPETVRQLVDRSPLLVEEAKNAQLVDRLGYWDEFTDAVRARAGKEAKGLKFSAYAANVESPGPDGTDVALIYGVGPIQSGDADNSPWDSDVFAAASVARAIDDAVKDQAIKAILLRIDSPGGSYIGSDTVRRAVLRARKKGKPVIASMGSYGASGGYFVAMGADKIVAQPGTMTGSIGVFGGKLATTDLWEKLGINWNRLNVGAHAGMWSQIFPFSPTAAARHRAVIDFVYDDFARKAAVDRGMSDDQVDAVARGRIWSGTGAQRVGLVDALGGYATAASLVREALKLGAEAPLNFVVLPEPLSPLDRVREALNDGVPLMQILVSQVSEARPDTMAAVGRYLEPVFGDTSVLRPPAGVLQLPPLRLAP
ncbi:MAG: S49 family peptidase, partial [Rhodospirillaceae bacterium]|nr:S49 family peptidase [Rhodospirillaceae bacterium]